MRAFAAIIILAVVAAGIIGPQALFTVDETQLAMVTRFGQVQRSFKAPGLYAKVPFVDAVTYFDKRLLIFDAIPDSFLTKDKKRLIVDVYARGKIVDPKLFRETLTTEAQATSRAVDIISSELRTEIARDNQAEIITTKRENIMARVKASVAPKLAEFGLEIVDVRIKRADFPVEIADSVYARMQAERKRKADKERAEGAEVDAQVRSNVDRQATIISANAERDANIVRGCGEAEATGIFAQSFNQDPEFFSFQRSLEANKKILTSRDTVLLPVDRLGEIFEDIRQGVLAGSQAAVPVNGFTSDDDLGAACAEVAARRFVSSDLATRLRLDIDTTRLELVGSRKVEWPDASLGCPEAGKEYRKDPIPGFSVTLRYEGTIYELHTNQHGSLILACPS
ncbi:MAG: protease modulator HflC [Chloroflexi bacterium]|nr:protease modulator HflC [Chloroflexota bacterium]